MSRSNKDFEKALAAAEVMTQCESTLEERDGVAVLRLSYVGGQALDSELAQRIESIFRRVFRGRYKSLVVNITAGQLGTALDRGTRWLTDFLRQYDLSHAHVARCLGYEEEQLKFIIDQDLTTLSQCEKIKFHYYCKSVALERKCMETTPNLPPGFHQGPVTRQDALDAIFGKL